MNPPWDTAVSVVAFIGFVILIVASIYKIVTFDLDKCVVSIRSIRLRSLLPLCLQSRIVVEIVKMVVEAELITIEHKCVRLSGGITVYWEASPPSVWIRGYEFDNIPRRLLKRAIVGKVLHRIQDEHLDQIIGEDFVPSSKNPANST